MPETPPEDPAQANALAPNANDLAVATQPAPPAVASISEPTASAPASVPTASPRPLPIHAHEQIMMCVGAAILFAALCTGPSIALSVLLGLGAWTVLIALAAVAIGVWLGVRFGRAEHRLYEVLQLPDGLLVKRGVFWRAETFVPRSRIQHTEVNQGPLDRRWGMASLTLHTAGTHVQKIEVSGLHHPDAIRLRDALLDRHEGSDGA